MKHNEMFVGTGIVERYGRTCGRCGQVRAVGDLNYEALLHHGADKLECIDRYRCERARRRHAKREF